MDLLAEGDEEVTDNGEEESEEDGVKQRECIRF